MATETNLDNLVINYLTKEQYDTATKNENELYFVTNANEAIGIDEGGTGATDAVTARENLGITPENIGAAAIDHTHDEYAPASHVSDTTKHITAEERAAWNGKAAETHAGQHASGGSDPITPASIGAASATDLLAHTDDITIHVTEEDREVWNNKQDKTFKPEGTSYLTFSSPDSFTVGITSKPKKWNGTLEYFSSDKTWVVWDGTTPLSAVDNSGEYVLYIRGTGNTVISGGSTGAWNLNGSNIFCVGNIENLLDYATVKAGNHPAMADSCYEFMFSGCTGLTQAPDLPATTLANSCYTGMFYSCTNLTKAPNLPATTLANYCYNSMFYYCTSLTQAPALPAIVLAQYCYANMFEGCTGLTQVPDLPAITLAERCCWSMFKGCTNLTKAPALPATTLAQHCYGSMFSECTNLTQAPDLPATILAESCYNSMFYSCTSLVQAPALPATILANYCYCSMFEECISLTQAPALPATTLADYCYTSMFTACTNLIQIPALPATTLANYCYNSMFNYCRSIKISSTQTEEYNQEYRIPISGTGIDADSSLRNMFKDTRGTFTGTPSINTTYYLSSSNKIVREAPVDSVNGRVGDIVLTAEDIGAAPASNFNTHISDTTIHVTANEKAAWNGKANVNIYTGTIGTNWTEDSDTGVKYQIVSISGITASNTAKVDNAYTGDGSSDSYATFVEQQNQYLNCITNGYAETVSGGIKFYIFGDPNTVSIPIVVEVV